MKIDAFASQRHYLSHIAPVWHALPEDVRGLVYVNLNVNEFTDDATKHDLPIAKGRPPWRGQPEPLILAGGADLWAHEGRPIVLLEHGAGQSYLGVDAQTYSGGFGRDAVVLFLCPNETVAARNRDRYPKASAIAVGAPTVRFPDSGLRKPTTIDEAVVAVSWHWDCPLVPESRSSWKFWADAALDLAHHTNVLGHAHPRIAREIIPWWIEQGIRASNNWEAVNEEADVYVCDNSSTLYEFAATGRPVVVLDAPWYRRDVEHGLRFWSHADIGIRISRTEDLVAAVDLAVRDPSFVAARRLELCADVFPVVGEQAAWHAASEITALL